MRRVPELDALRGVAAFFIMLFHLRFLETFPRWGSLVDLFFVLSGYLITTIIFQTYQTEHFFKNFYIRRALRIWPIYYLTIPFVYLVNAIIPRQDPMRGLGYVLTYTQFLPAYWGGEVPFFSRHFLHSWTLAIEEQFYLLWPLAVVLLGRKRLPALIVPLIVLPTFMRSWGYYRHLLGCRCDGLALGALLAVLLYDGARFERNREAFRRTFGAVALAAATYGWWSVPLLTAAGRTWPGQSWMQIWISLDTFRLCVLYFGIVGVVLCSIGHPLLGPLRLRGVVYTGKISYGLYLYHPLVFVLVTYVHLKLGLKNSVWMDTLKALAAYGVASLSWELIEKPILSLKDRFAYVPTTPREAEAGLFRGPHAVEREPEPGRVPRA